MNLVHVYTSPADAMVLLRKVGLSALSLDTVFPVLFQTGLWEGFRIR